MDNSRYLAGLRISLNSGFGRDNGCWDGVCDGEFRYCGCFGCEFFNAASGSVEAGRKA